jgi:octanoyl-[GcvH]:protein N-octanoyltransferase
VDIEAFGAGSVTVRFADPRSGEADVRYVRQRLAAVRDGASAELDVMCPPPTAAFGSSDARLPGYPQACADLEAVGFSAMVRPVGGHLAVYDEAALVVHLTAPHPAALDYITARFKAFAGALVTSLSAFGVDARVGPVPGEYCEGAFSVNRSGCAKLAGTGQRVTRGGYAFSAVVSVCESGRVRQALEIGYAALGLDLRPQTVGCVADTAPGVTVDQARREIVAALGRVLPLTPTEVCGSPALNPRGLSVID